LSDSTSVEITLGKRRPGVASKLVVYAFFGCAFWGIAAASGLAIGIGGGVVLAYFTGFVAVALGASKRFAIDNNQAVTALSRGELTRARELYAGWARHWYHPVSATARHGLGWTLLLDGRLDEAATILGDLAANHAATLKSSLRRTYADAGLCNVLLGKVDVAELLSAKAEEPIKGPSRPTFPGFLALLRALIACRRDRAAEARVTLEQALAEHEAVMTGKIIRIMRVAHAFASAAADGPRSQGTVERILGDMRPRYERELTFLGVSWPEMAAFLAAHQLG
jgi:hypothetical protein